MKRTANSPSLHRDTPLALPITQVKLRERINAAVTTIDKGVLQNIWTELDYHLDVCCVTNGAYIQYL
jgi:hypothetical protein